MQLLIVADAARARFYTLDDELDITGEVCDLVHPEARMRAGDIYEGDPGRGAGASTPSDRKEIAAEQFARSVAQEAASRAGTFERLHIAAPPKFLGQLRKALDGSVERKVASTLAKDLTKVPAHDLGKMLRGR
ncbi:MAG: host attachment protein [Myxococcales bacterium]|nr:host attachment protein [Myxococcales bacterium]MCB9670912.1 host attachment protein [Alphaproteobacteria bacterium]